MARYCKASAQLSAEIQADIAELNLRATRRLGEISATLEKAKGNRFTKVELPSGGSSKTAALAEIGVSPQRANEAEKIASIPENVFDGILKSSKSGVSKADIAKLAKIEPEKQMADYYLNAYLEPPARGDCHAIYVVYPLYGRAN
jgi:hypothetical protein